MWLGTSLYQLTLTICHLLLFVLSAVQGKLAAKSPLDWGKVLLGVSIVFSVHWQIDVKLNRNQFTGIHAIYWGLNGVRYPFIVAHPCHSFSGLTLSSLQIDIVTKDFKAELQARSKATNRAECIRVRYNLYDVVCCGCSDQCKMAYFNSWPWTCLVTFLNYSNFDAEFPARQNVRRGSAHGLPSRRSRCLCRRTVSAADGDRPLPARRADPGLACPVSSSLQIYLVPTSQNGQMFAV